MSSRKEEERNEKIIRGLMKLPPNRRCINCNSLGPQYVCTNFWTFVCMTCSGIHREFTHRVKSVSMSKFTTQEVEALQEGGNQRARETFLKDWDPREHRLPDNSNVDKVRAFIKSVYVDKKFFASKASGKPPRDTLNPRNNEDETRRASSYHSYSQSPPYDYQYEERRYGKQAPALTKKPGSDRGMFRFLSTSRLSDHVQEDRFANEVPNARVSDYSASSGGDPFRSATQSPTYQHELGFSSPGNETSRDILSDDIQKSSVNTFANLKAKGDTDQVTNAQKPASPTPEQSVVTQHIKESQKFDGLDLFSAPYAPQSTASAPSTESQKFDGLDLFSAPYAPQSTTSAPSAIDLFDLSATSSTNTLQPPPNPVAPKAFEPSSLDLFAVMPHQQSTEPLKDKSTDEGWATFDMPWHAETTKSSTVVPETSTSDEKVGQAPSMVQNPNWSSHQEFNASGPSPLMHNSWHDSLNANNNNNNQSWNAFGESTTPFESIYTKSSAPVPVQDPLAADPYFSWGISENFNMKQPAHAIGSLESSSQLPVLDVARPHGLDTKSRNPFDFPIDDDDLESSNMFLDMSSLHSSLPNHNDWFSESANLPYSPGKSQDPLAFMAPSMQIPNIQAQGPVASVSGNPFG